VFVSFMALFAACALVLPALQRALYSDDDLERVGYGIAVLLAVPLAALIGGMGIQPLCSSAAKAYRLAFGAELSTVAIPGRLGAVGGYGAVLLLCAGLAGLYAHDATQRAEPLLHGLSAVGIGVFGGGGTLVIALPVLFVVFRTFGGPAQETAAAPPTPPTPPTLPTPPTPTTPTTPPTSPRTTAGARPVVGFGVAAVLGLLLALAADQIIDHRRVLAGSFDVGPGMTVSGRLVDTSDRWPAVAQVRLLASPGDVREFGFTGSCWIALAKECAPVKVLEEVREGRPWSITVEAQKAGHFVIEFTIPTGAKDCEYRGQFVEGAGR
jgi:hypothetical protein